MIVEISQCLVWAGRFQFHIFFSRSFLFGTLVFAFFFFLLPGKTLLYPLWRRFFNEAAWHSQHFVLCLTGHIKHCETNLSPQQITSVLILFNGLVFFSYQISQADRQQRKIFDFLKKTFRTPCFFKTPLEKYQDQETSMADFTDRRSRNVLKVKQLFEQHCTLSLAKLN